jgi:hypothetical protein
MLSIEVRAILAMLERILAMLLGLLGLGQALGVKLDKTAAESTPYRIQGQVDWIGQQLTAEPYSLPVLHNQLTAIIAALDGINQPVLDAIAALPAGSDIVIPSTGENAEAVWMYQGDYRDRTGNMLAKLDETNTKIGPTAGYLAPATPWFARYDPTSFID